MTQAMDDLMQMAREAGFTVGLGSPMLPKLDAFAQLVAKKAVEVERARVKEENARCYVAR